MSGDNRASDAAAESDRETRFSATGSRRESVATSLAAGPRVAFALLRVRWWLQAHLRRVYLLARRHAGSVRHSLIALIALALGLLADGLGAGDIPKGDLANYLVATGVMIGGTAAIVFSISLFLLQGVRDMYSSRHLEDYVNHWRDQLIFPVIIVIALGFFGSALYVASRTAMSSGLGSVIVIASLLSMGVVFGLIDQQYEVVRRKVSPARVIDFLRSKAHRFIRTTQRQAAHVAQLLRISSEGISHDEALAVAYSRVLVASIADLGRQTELLVDIALRLAERQEVETARFALRAVGEILAAYLEARRTSSVARPSPHAFLATESDSQPFLSSRYEQLNRAGMTFVHAGQDDLAAEVVDVYRTVARSAKDIRHLGLIDENPILESTMLSLDSYMRDAFAARNVEVVFQGTEALKEIGVMANANGLDAILLAVQDRVEQFGTLSLGFNTTVVFDRATSGLLDLLTAAFSGCPPNRRHVVERSLQGVGAMIATLTDILQLGAVKDEFSTSQALVSAYTRLPAIVSGIVRHYQTLDGDDKKRVYRRDLVMLFEELRRHFREMTKAIKADSLTAQSIGRLIAHVNQIIIALLGRPEFEDVAEDLRNALKWLCHSPYWFLSGSEAFDVSAGAVTALVDAVAQTGIMAWRAGDADVVAECIAAIHAMAKAAVEKDSGSSPHAEARIMERACYLGILARKSGWTHVVMKLKADLDEFEAAFVKKYVANIEGRSEGFDPYDPYFAGSSYRYQVPRDLLNWAERFDYERFNGVHFMRNADDMMYELIDAADIQRYVNETWAIE